MVATAALERLDARLDSPNRNSATVSVVGQNSRSKTIEQRYQKKTPVEHILHRPESYIGSVQPDSQSCWVWDEERQRMCFRPITVVPGLYKIFDEILVNAADNKAREGNEGSRKSTAQKMCYVKVSIDVENNSITIMNDGEGIPVEIHKEHNVYVPELIFGHLLTSDNYDDTEQRVTGGRNGYGAKLTNIFSKSFTVECADTNRKRKFRKVWRNNMSTSDPCKISDFTEAKDYVKVTFSPDLARFQTDRIDSDHIALFTKRVYDVAGCCAVKVWLNGRRLQVENFKSYVDLYFPPKSSAVKTESPPSPDSVKTNPSEMTAVESLSSASNAGPIKIHEKSGRWEVVISLSDGQFQQVSFVNCISTSKGGTHVNYVADPLVQAILKKVNAKNKGGMELKAHHVKAHLWMFVNCLVVNPTFDSQTKDTLTSKPMTFGSKFQLAEKTINAVIKSEIVENVLLWARTKQQVELQKKMKGTVGRGGRDRVSGIPKLEDANDAGSRNSEECTLILTEGESAKTSCVAGLSVVGRDKYGVFPLRGKLLNVREASFKQQIENQEIQAILKIMGLQVGRKIESPKGLRYGSLMIMTDQDLDGSHIKGLLINMIAHYWPSLLKYRGFLKEFVTPIVKVSRKNQELSFFTLTEYSEWQAATNGGKGWKIKYYKGLGTSTDKEFKEYFSHLERHSLEFLFEGDEDLDAIDLAFNGKRAEDRKQWIQNYTEGTFVDHSKPTLTYTDFINKELVLFSRYDSIRSIPNCIDGFKPVQRKVLFAAFKRNLRAEVKVAQFTGYISEKTSYHHGEQSLGATIVGMAQSFVGANNICFLDPCGQFGSRKEGGKDASATRYIFTRLTPLARAIFPEADDPLLEYQNDDGLMIEPKFYVPVIPVVLANGVEGIGTGWSTYIPNYNPRDIIANVRRFIRGEPMEPMIPWYRGFNGRIERKGPGGFEAVGTIRKLDDETLEVSELPVKLWTQNFKQLLEEMLPGADTASSSRSAPSNDGTENTGRGRGGGRGGSGGITILDYRDNSTHEEVMFTIKMSPAMMERAEREGLEKVFRLRKQLSTTNMTLFDATLRVHRYLSELDILRDCGQLRLQYYELRRAYLIEKLERERRILYNRVRFIEAVIKQKLQINNRKRDLILKDMVAMGLDPLTKIHKASELIWKLEQRRAKFESEMEVTEAEEKSDVEPERIISDVEENENTIQPKEYEYLLGQALWTLTSERVDELKKQLKQKQEELDELQKKTPEMLWEDDLVQVEKALDDQDQRDVQLRAEHAKFRQARQMSLQPFKRRGGKGRPAVRGKQQVKLEKSGDDAGPSPARRRKGRNALSDSESSSSDSSSPGDASVIQDDDESDGSKMIGLSKTNAVRVGTARSGMDSRATRKESNARVDVKLDSTASSGSSAWSRLMNQSREIPPDSNNCSGSGGDLVNERSNAVKSYSLAERIRQRLQQGPANESAASAPSQAKTLDELLGLFSTGKDISSGTGESITVDLDSNENSKQPAAKSKIQSNGMKRIKIPSASEISEISQTTIGRRKRTGVSSSPGPLKGTATKIQRPSPPKKSRVEVLQQLSSDDNEVESASAVVLSPLMEAPTGAGISRRRTTVRAKSTRPITMDSDNSSIAEEIPSDESSSASASLDDGSDASSG